MRPMYLARGTRGGFLRAFDVRVKGVGIKLRLNMFSFWLCVCNLLAQRMLAGFICMVSN